MNSYLTNSTSRSVRLQFSGACGAIGIESADISADSGAHFESATSSIQSVSANTKLSFASVSLCSRSSKVSAGSSGAWKVIECSSVGGRPPPAAMLLPKKFRKPPVVFISGSVNARCPNTWWLLFSIRVGLPSAGNFIIADDNVGELVPDRRNGDVWVAGLTCHVDGGGGVSDNELPDAERCRPPIGGVPIANCTAGGDIELRSELLLFRCSERFMLIGWDRGMTFDESCKTR